MENNEARHIFKVSFAGLHSGERRTVELPDHTADKISSS
jgi:hypothetical protein